MKVAIKLYVASMVCGAVSGALAISAHYNWNDTVMGAALVLATVGGAISAVAAFIAIFEKED